MSLIRTGCALLLRHRPAAVLGPQTQFFAARATSRPGHGRDGGPRLNGDLRGLAQVRLVSADGGDQGVMTGAAALARARDAGLDLMQVHGGGGDGVAVARLLDYAAHVEAQKRGVYEAARRKKAAPRASGGGAVRLKQVRLSPSTGPHDRAIKLRQAKGFLADGHRVRVYMQFRRGQGRLKNDAKAALAEVARELAPLGILRGVDSIDDVAQLFDDPPPDPAAPADAPRPQKPLEVLFDPLRKAQREKAVREAAAAEAAAAGDG